jgi:copper(I)-binding protein
MRLRTIIELLVALFLTFAAIVAISQMAKASGIKVENAYARASLGASTSSVVYMTLVNEAAAPDRLRSASTTHAASAELHLHRLNGDVMSMAKVACLTIPAGGKVELAPGGLHIMLQGLKAPLKEGGKLPLRLRFDHAGEVSLEVPVKSAAIAAQTGSNLQFCD